MTTADVPPSDYRLLVPRDWFRIDLTNERWRRHLKTFVDKQSAGSRVRPEATRSLWTTLRNTAEGGVARGALEFFLKAESPDATSVPASLLVAMVPMPLGMAPQADEFANALSRRVDLGTDVDVIELPAGEAVRAVTETTMDFHIRMPGDVGYLHLAYSSPLSGTHGPMGDLCDAIAHSLRWVA